MTHVDNNRLAFQSPPIKKSHNYPGGVNYSTLPKTQGAAPAAAYKTKDIKTGVLHLKRILNADAEEQTIPSSQSRMECCSLPAQNCNESASFSPEGMLIGRMSRNIFIYIDNSSSLLTQLRLQNYSHTPDVRRRQTFVSTSTIRERFLMCRKERDSEEGGRRDKEL